LREQGTQLDSKTMNVFVDQSELALARPPQQVEIPIELVRAKKNSGAAFTLACDASGLEDKEIYMALGIDAGYFSNIKKGKATLQADLVSVFCTIVGNSIYLEWLAYQIGCTLMMLRTEAERRADSFEKLLEQERLKNRVLVEALHGKVAS
jgi:hypothetical protein